MGLPEVDRGQCLSATWHLLRSRHSPESIGEMAGFTLNYLLGFAKASVVRNAAAAGPIGGDIGKLFQTVAQDKDVNTVKDTLTRLYSALTGEFYALSRNNKLRKKDEQMLDRFLSTYFAFLRGFYSGTRKRLMRFIERRSRWPMVSDITTVTAMATIKGMQMVGATATLWVMQMLGLRQSRLLQSCQLTLTQVIRLTIGSRRLRISGIL